MQNLLSTVGFAPRCCARPTAIDVGPLRGLLPPVSSEKDVGQDQLGKEGLEGGLCRVCNIIDCICISSKRDDSLTAVGP